MNNQLSLKEILMLTASDGCGAKEQAPVQPHCSLLFRVVYCPACERTGETRQEHSDARTSVFCGECHRLLNIVYKDGAVSQII